jgi:two-component system, cell cycle sensor histidine kinase and response regulator CckA
MWPIPHSVFETQTGVPFLHPRPLSVILMPPSYDLEHILNAIAEPVFVKDRAHRWIFLNDAYCRLIGVERSSLLGKSDYDFFPQAEADLFWQMDELVFETGKENASEEQFTDSHGIQHLITTKKMLYVNHAGDKFIVGCINDLTQQSLMRRELEQAREKLEQKVHERTVELEAINERLYEQITNHERTSELLRHSQKMEAIGQLAGGIAHDFNNLLNIIIGYGALIERWPGSEPKVLEAAEHIISAAETAASLTRQLLAFSRKQVLQPEILELNELVNKVGGMLGRLIGEDIQLEIKAAPDTGSIRVDRGQFEQVIINLAVNARDAMPSGGKLTIATAPTESVTRSFEGDTPQQKEYVAVIVSDTGKGMQPEVQAHIFEPFFTTKEQGKGTGLGLATVYGIVTQSSGTISVRSSPGMGSTFTILLPKVEGRSVSPGRKSDKALPQRGFGTVLLVEDQKDLRILLREVLLSHGYIVIDVASGVEAIAASTGRHDVALLITDIVMPGMRGWELAKILRSKNPNMKVLYISGHTDTDLINDGAHLVDGTFLEKPFRPEVLLSKVQEIMCPQQAHKQSI